MGLEKEKIEGMPTEKESSSEVVETLFKQYSHVSSAITKVYTQQIEKVCKDKRGERINESVFEVGSVNSFSYKQPCCTMAKELQTYVLTSCLNPLEDKPHLPVTSFCVHQPTSKSRSASSHSLTCSASGILGTSARHNNVLEQKISYSSLKAEIQSSADLTKFRDFKLKSFHSVMLTSSKNSLWICGQKKSKKLGKTGKYKPVFICVEPPSEYKMMCKKTYNDQKIETPTILLHIPNLDLLYFTGRNENAVYSLNTFSREFKRKFSTDKLEIAAMCNNQGFLYSFNGNNPGTVSILDESFQPIGNIETSLKNVFEKQCDFVDMCVLNHEDTIHTVVISTSFPAIVRAVSQSARLRWQLDDKAFGKKFKPCSVTASSLGIVFIADCGTDKVQCIIIGLSSFLNTNSNQITVNIPTQFT